MKKPDKILDLIEDRDKGIFEFQRVFIERFLNRFPQIEDEIKENVKFYLFIMGIPYYKENKEDFQHECILQTLAGKQSGIVNLSLNVEEISSHLYSVDMPVWTDAFSEISIQEQWEMLRKEIN